jgi:hypothetical protein
LGVLKVRIGNAWEEVSGGGAEEVWIGPLDPYLTDPDATQELWFETTRSQLWARWGGGWRLATSSATNEVFIGTAQPAEPEVELWYDPDEVGTVGGEVHIGDTDPLFLDPTSTNELWFDTDDPGLAGNGGIVPPGGTTGQPLVKLSDADHDVGWGTVANYNATFQSGWSGPLSFRVTPTMVTVSGTPECSADLAVETWHRVCVLPAGVPAPWMPVWAEGRALYASADRGQVLVEVSSVGLSILPIDLIEHLNEIRFSLTWAR